MSAGILLRPGAMALADWRAIYFGAPVALDEGCRAAVEAGAATIDAILAKHEPVYGINTGFGKLASVRIPDGDLAQLQRNLVLSHAAGVGEPLPAPSCASRWRSSSPASARAPPACAGRR